jgi:hypothetical protein
MINTRDEINLLLRSNSVGCELGVFEGEFSEILLKENKFSKLYLVDLFEGIVESGDKSGNNIKYKNSIELLNTVKNKFSNKDCVEIVKKDSVSFLKSFPDNYFDFIYIDTSHQYEHTKNELNISLRKIKKSGIIAGHDYNPYRFAGVVSAVDEFSKENNLKLNLTKLDTLETFYFILND